MLILKIFHFLSSWLWFVLKSLFFMIFKDTVFLLKSLNYYILMLFDKKYFIIKNMILYFYFIYPVYLILKLIFFIYVFFLRYFVFFLFNLLFLIDTFGFSVNKLNLFMQNHLKNSLVLYSNFNKFFDEGLFNFLSKLFKLIVFYIIYFVIYDLIPLLLLPFVIIFVYFRKKFRILNDLYIIKIAQPARNTIPYILRKLGLQFSYFYDYWFYAILRFFFYLIPFYSWQTFLPLFLNYTYIFINKLLLNIIFLIIYFMFNFLYLFIFLFNIIIYLNYMGIKLLINLFLYYANNLSRFIYLIFFKIPFYIFFVFIYLVLNFKNLVKILYSDLKSLYIILKNYINCSLLLLKYR